MNGSRTAALDFGPRRPAVNAGSGSAAPGHGPRRPVATAHAGSSVAAADRRGARAAGAAHARSGSGAKAAERRGALAVAIVAGYAADRLLGDPRRFHPVAGFGLLALRLERVLYKPRRSAGVAYTGALVGGAAALGARLRVDLATLEMEKSTQLLRVAAIWSVLGGRSLGREADRIAALVAAEDIAGARAAIPALVGRDPSALDGAGLCRAAIESLAENTVDAVVAPLLWAAAAGPAGALGYRATNTLDAMVGHHSERYERFGWASARLDDLANWPAARLAAALAVAFAPLVGGDPRAARAVWARDADLHPSPNGGQIEAAFAGALGLRLGGPVVYGTRREERPWLGDGRAPGPDDVRAAIRLASLVGAASALLAAALACAPRAPNPAAALARVARALLARAARAPRPAAELARAPRPAAALARAPRALTTAVLACVPRGPRPAAAAPAASPWLAPTAPGAST